MAEIVYVALAPLRAGHPVGSGEIVEYVPGDIVPAHTWGRAADTLVEMGKLGKYAVNVHVDELEGGTVAAAVPPAPGPKPRKKVD